MFKCELCGKNIDDKTRKIIIGTRDREYTNYIVIKTEGRRMLTLSQEQVDAIGEEQFALNYTVLKVNISKGKEITKEIGVCKECEVGWTEQMGAVIVE